MPFIDLCNPLNGVKIAIYITSIMSAVSHRQELNPPLAIRHSGIKPMLH